MVSPPILAISIYSNSPRGVYPAKGWVAEYGISADDISAGPAREPFSDETADAIESFKPEVVSFHFGLPAKSLVERVRSWGAKVLSSATTVEEALCSDDGSHTAVTNIFSGRPARGLVNRVIREIGPMNDNVAEFPLAASAITALRSRAENRGSGDFSPLWCGQNATGCKPVSAATLTRELADVAHCPDVCVGTFDLREEKP